MSRTAAKCVDSVLRIRPSMLCPAEGCNALRVEPRESPFEKKEGGGCARKGQTRWPRGPTNGAGVTGRRRANRVVTRQPLVKVIAVEKCMHT